MPNLYGIGVTGRMGEWLDGKTLDLLQRKGVRLIRRCLDHELLLSCMGATVTIIVSNPLPECLCEEAAQDLAVRLVNDAGVLAVVIEKRTWTQC